MPPRPRLTLIQSTHASLDGFKQTGLLERHRRLLQAYAEAFDVVVYSADHTDYSSVLGVRHHPVPGLPRTPGLRHLIYYVWLVAQAPRLQGVIKVLGSNIPTLALIKRLSGRPMLITYSYDYATQTRLSTHNPLRRVLAPSMEWLALAPADLVSVSTDWLQVKAQTQYHKSTVLLPNWVDLNGGPADGLARDPGLVLFAGRLHWSKGLPVLLEAFARLQPRGAAARLVICGAGQEEKRLKAQAASLGLATVEIRGAVPNSEVTRLMRQASIFVLPTLTMEGQAKALLEAMSAGAACIVSDVPGNRELIRSGENGLLVPPDDPGALAEALENLLAHAALCTKLGQQAAADAQQFAFGPVVKREIQVLLALGQQGRA